MFLTFFPVFFLPFLVTQNIPKYLCKYAQVCAYIYIHKHTHRGYLLDKFYLVIVGLLKKQTFYIQEINMCFNSCFFTVSRIKSCG